MAAANIINSLKCEFAKQNGDVFSFTFKYIKPDVSDGYIKSFLEGIVANGNIFEKVPASIVSATLISETKREIDLS